jgi:peptidoglycan/xylan/chitin deacetylase (PgdA/CDA1 family)
MDQNGAVIAHAASLGLTTIDWDDDTRDWSRPGAQAIANVALAEAHPGAIIIMHDGPANREETLAALPLILAGLQARGLKPVTVPQLLMDGGYSGVRLPSGPGAPLWRVPALVSASHR